MNSILDVLTRLRVWQIFVLVGVVIGTVGALYVIFRTVSGPGDGGLAAGQQFIPISRGDLVNDISINGSLVYSKREILRFSSNGTLSDLLVTEGESVTSGQALARLDIETIANLDKAVAQARVNLRNAEDAFESAKNPYSEQEIKKAEADVAVAQQKLNNAEDALANLLKPGDLALAKAQLAVVNAELALENVEEGLLALLSPSEIDVAKAENALVVATVSVDNAQLALDSAEEKITSTNLSLSQSQLAVTNAKMELKTAQESLDDLMAWPTRDDEDEIADREDKLSDSKKHLEDWKDKVKGSLETYTDHISLLEGAILDAASHYDSAFEKWLGVKPGDDRDIPPDDLLVEWEIDLQALFDVERWDFPLWDWTEPVTDDPATKWNESTVYTWVTFYPGNLVSLCEDDSSLTSSEISALINTNPGQAAAASAEVKAYAQVGSQALGQYTEICIKKEIVEAFDLYRAASDKLEATIVDMALVEADYESQTAAYEREIREQQENLDELKSGPDPLEIEQHENELGLAKVKLKNEQEILEELTTGSTELELKSLRAQLVLAQANRDEAEAKLTALKEQAGSSEAEVYRKQVSVAKANLNVAREDLDALTNEPDSLELSVKETQLALAKTDLSSSIETLGDMKIVDALDISLKESAVASANAALLAAVDARDESTLLAPWDGIVLTVHGEEGRSVNPNTQILEVVDPDEVEVEGVLDEIDVLFVQVGSRVTITLEALEGQMLDGIVTSIGSTVQSSQGVVSYPVSVKISSDTETRLLEGLTAVVQVIIREEKNQLLVPIQALHGTFELPTVLVERDGKVIEIPVELGISDDFWTVITAGLSDGDLVAIEMQETEASGFNTGFSRRFQSGAPPGFGPGGFSGGGRN